VERGGEEIEIHRVDQSLWICNVGVGRLCIRPA
jgi:hypothetical protein